MSQHADFLLVGGGLANATAAQTLRVAGAEGSIAIVSAEELPPYHRPPLSKGFLLGTEDQARILIHSESFYREHAIDLLLNTRALSVDPPRQVVTTTAGDIGYGQLLIATGGVPNTPRAAGSDLPGVFTLRTKGDADAIRRAAQSGRRAVVGGGSYLGMEVAMALAKLGLDVTVLSRSPVIFPYLAAPSLSACLKQFVENHGVAILLNESGAEAHGQGKLEEVVTASGRRLPCDLLVVAIGISPATEFLVGSGIALDDGYIVVDDRMRTNAPNVYAAGDVTSFYDPVFARRRHIEHWDNAVKQGRLAAYNMMGRRLRYEEVSYFFCDLGDLSFAMLGDTEEADELIGRGSLENRNHALFYLRNNILRAIFSTGRPPAETRSAEGLIRSRTNLSAVKERLHEPDFALDAIPVQTVLILQGGGALGAFECGVVKALEEAKIFPDVVAGVSIGAFNGAIIAGNPRHATQALEAFWRELAVDTSNLGLFPAPPSKAAIAMNILAFGVPKFFKPRWLPPYGDPTGLLKEWTSLYDPTPMRALISKYVDFDALKASPVRLLVGAVNVTTAEFEVFDSYVDDLTPDHLLASGSLPPGFPWTTIDGKPYWDGGIVSNSPLDFVMDCCGPGGKRVFVVDLFRGNRPLPTNLMEVLARRDEIVYAERIRSDLRYRELVNAYRALVDDVLGHLEPEEVERIKQRPGYIQLMGDGESTSIIRLIRPAHEGEPASRDYDFSDTAIRGHLHEGYVVAKQALGMTGI